MVMESEASELWGPAPPFPWSSWGMRNGDRDRAGRRKQRRGNETVKNGCEKQTRKVGYNCGETPMTKRRSVQEERNGIGNRREKSTVV